MIPPTRRPAARALLAGVAGLTVLVATTIGSLPAHADDGASAEPTAQASTASARSEAEPEQSAKRQPTVTDSPEPSAEPASESSATSDDPAPKESATPASSSAPADASEDPDATQEATPSASADGGQRTAARSVRAAATAGTTYPGSSDASVTFTVPTEVTAGAEITISGTGWKVTDGSRGSVIGIKLDDGGVSTKLAVTNPETGAVQGNKTIWAIAAADADGDWTATFPYPTAENSDATWAAGETHNVRLLTGSLVAGDRVRSETASFTVVPAGTSACASDQVSVADTSGGQTARACIQQDVSTGTGRTIALSGHGWLTKDGRSGSTVVLKLTSRISPSAADFQFVHAGGAGDAVLSHPVNGSQDPTIWAIVRADADGDFATTVPVPGTANVPGNIDAAGALAAGHKLVVHLQSGLLDADTQHTVDSASLVVDGTPYPGDQDAAVTPCTLPAGGYQAHLVYPDGQTENTTTGPVLDYGQSVRLVGTGWCNSDPAKGGSTIAIKIDEGAYSHRAGELVNANPQVWQVVTVDSADGSFDVPVTLPRSGDVAGGSTPAFAEGVHTLRLLTGSLKAGDPVRTLQTGPFTLGTYRPNGYPAPVEAKEDLTAASRHGVIAVVGSASVTVTIPGAKAGDWAFLTAYLADGSVRYPWTSTWFQADTAGVVTASRSGVTLPTGTWKLTVQGPDGSLLGWTNVTVASTSEADTSTSVAVVTDAAVVTDEAGSSAPATVPKPPVADDSGLTAANAGGVTGTQDGTVVTVTLPSRVTAGSWVYLYVYSTPTAVGWVQVDDHHQVRVDLGLMPAGVHKIAVLDADGGLIGWTSATVAAAAQVPESAPVQTGSGTGPVAEPVVAGGPNWFTSADAGLVGVAVVVLLAAAAAVVVVQRRRFAGGGSGQSSKGAAS